MPAELLYIIVASKHNFSKENQLNHGTRKLFCPEKLAAIWKSQTGNSSNRALGKMPQGLRLFFLRI